MLGTTLCRHNPPTWGVTIPVGIDTLGDVDSTARDLAGCKAIAYLRVSSNDQVERGTIAVQRREVARWAKAHGVKVVQWCEDEAISGKLDHTNRPGLACALEAVEAKRANVVVMWKLDRLA